MQETDFAYAAPMQIRLPITSPAPGAQRLANLGQLHVEDLTGHLDTRL
jgi:hypothetical protein